MALLLLATAHNVVLATAAVSIPMPFPLPANFSFGKCGMYSNLIPNCVTSMALASNISIRCSSSPGCTTACKTSTLFQQVLSRYEARLSGQSKGHSTVTQTSMAANERQNKKATHKNHNGRDNQSLQNQNQYWWRLNNINCNLHDIPNGMSVCSGLSISQCKDKCQHEVPDCGGFLYYTKTGAFALKNSTCWEDLAGLPPIDDGDDLFVLHDTPQPMPGPTHPGVLTTVEVCVQSDSETLSSSTAEDYEVMVPDTPAGVATVSSSTVFGMMHGLETLTQLVEVRARSMVIPSAPVWVKDSPRFSYRGLLIDSGRHFLPVTQIKHIVEAASMLKLNVLHWHLVDSQSFPSCSDTFPKLCAEGGYPNAVSGRADGVEKAVYTTDQLRDVVAFAKSHGVRIVPEWDMPGHGGWYFGMPSLNTSRCPSALDVTRPQLYTFLRQFLTEMAGIFPEETLFLGGDELAISCFDESPSIAAWMKAHGLNSSSTQQYFWQQMTALVLPHLNKTVSVWRADDPDRGPHAHNLPRGSIFNVYQSLNTAWTATIPSGVATVVSMAGQHWYLDSQCNGYNQNAWTCVYSFQGVRGAWISDPDWSPEERELMLGGEAALWGEGITRDNFDAYAWRGAAAAAERLWATEETLGCPPSLCPGITPRPGPSYWLQAGAPRLADQLCRMTRMGVRTGPIGPGFCPSDAAYNDREVEVRQNLEQQIAALRLEIAALKPQGN